MLGCSYLGTGGDVELSAGVTNVVLADEVEARNFLQLASKQARCQQITAEPNALPIGEAKGDCRLRVRKLLDRAPKWARRALRRGNAELLGGYDKGRVGCVPFWNYLDWWLVRQTACIINHWVLMHACLRTCSCIN